MRCAWNPYLGSSLHLLGDCRTYWWHEGRRREWGRCPLSLSSGPSSPSLCSGPSAACQTSQVRALGHSVGRAHRRGSFLAHLSPVLPALPLACVSLPEVPLFPGQAGRLCSESLWGSWFTLSPGLVLAVLCWAPPQFWPTLHPLQKTEGSSWRAPAQL